MLTKWKKFLTTERELRDILQGRTTKKRYTWKDFLKIEKNGYSILIFHPQLRGTIKHSLTVVWREDTVRKGTKTISMKETNRAMIVSCTICLHKIFSC
jgi:hypothetical protein